MIFEYDGIRTLGAMAGENLPDTNGTSLFFMNEPGSALRDVARRREWRIVAVAALAFTTGCDGERTSERAIGSSPQALNHCPGTLVTLGTPAPSQGSAQCNADNSWTLSSDGKGVLWPYAQTSQVDQLHFVQLPWTGDAEVVVRLTSFQGDAGAHAGVAIRENLADGGKIVAGYVRLDTCGQCATRGLPDDELLIAARTPEGGFEEKNEPPVGILPTETPGKPIWFRLQRIANGVAISRSANGQKWIPFQVMNGAGLPSASVHVGFFVAGGSGLATGTFDNVYIGPPRHPQPTSFKTEAIGASYASFPTHYISRGARSIFVAPDGRTYQSANGAELGEPTHLYRDGAVLANSGAASAKQAAITGDGSSVYLATCLPARDDDCLITRFDPDLNLQAAGPAILDQPAGIAVGNGELYVSEIASGQIAVFSADTLAELPGRRFDFPPACGTPASAGAQPGPLAVDGLGRLWILEPSVDYPIPGNLDVKRPARIRCMTSSGACCGEIALNKTGSVLTSNPAAIVYDPLLDRLLVAESGIWGSPPALDGQNIRIFGPMQGTPTELAPFGQPGGVYAGSTPGAYTDANAGGARRFYVPTGVGIDSAGAIYVRSGRATLDIRKFAPGQPAPDWAMYGLVDHDNGAFDPATDGLDYYTTLHHLRFNPNANTPGERWLPISVTWDPRREGKNADSPRLGATPTLRHFGGNRFMYTIGNSALHVYRFVGEQAFPCGRVGWDPAAHTIRIWVDGSGGGAVNGVEEAAELSPAVSEPVVSDQRWSGLSANGISIEPDGTIWLAFGTTGGLKLRVTGMANGVPVYSTDTSGSNPARAVVAVPQPFVSVDRFLYDAASNTMYVVGSIPDGGSSFCNGTPSGVVRRYLSQNADIGINREFIEVAYARYIDWSSSPQCQYVKVMPSAVTSDEFINRIAFYDGFTTGEPIRPELQIDGAYGYGYRGVSFAGDKLFFTWRSGPIHVVDGPTGEPLTTLWAGAELAGFQGWQDIPDGTQAFRRSDGEYLVNVADTSNHARNVLFRWSPSGGCEPDAPFEAPVRAFTDITPADGLALSADGLTAYVSGKQGTNYDLYVATRPNSESPFGSLTPLTTLNTTADERAPALSQDGLTIYFTRRVGFDDLYFATRASVSEAFGTPQPLAALNSSVHDQDPFFLQGHSSLYFASERPSGAQRELYFSTLVEGSFSAPQLLDGLVNSSSHEDYRPVLSNDGLKLYFASTRPGIGNDLNGDIFAAQRTSLGAAFDAPVPLPALNSSGVEFPAAMSPDGCTLYFASNRETGLGGTQEFRLFQATRSATVSPTVPVTLQIAGSGSVSSGSFNCSTGNVGVCTAQGQPGSTQLLQASGTATWTGTCAGNNGAPSTDGVLVYASGGVCTITFL